jgi:hypothetical protein
VIKASNNLDLTREIIEGIKWNFVIFDVETCFQVYGIIKEIPIEKESL